MSVSMAAQGTGQIAYPMSSLYPGMYTGPNQTEDTVPDVEEQQVLASIEDPAPKSVDKKQKVGILALLGALVALLVLFGRG
ncbi:hypothetical protein MKY96_33810 [Paenibacillus sp. FSL R7-0302]|uniref:hypothetical protein n=1 Tax=Paenibacillus sp. FSL R7-0302 TaxID=2921681 RepID=UPI0030F4BBC8